MSRTASISRRAASTGVVAALVGCTNAKHSGTKEGLKLLETTFSDRLYAVADVERTPYASIGVRLNDGPEAMVVLAAVLDRQLVWIAHDGTQIHTVNGRIVRYIGQGQNVSVEASQTRDPIADQHLPSSGTAHCLRMFDFISGNRYGVAAPSDVVDEGPSETELLYGTIKTRRLRESGEWTPLRTAFENSFDMDETAFIWSSRQFVAPDFPPVSIRLLRPYSGTTA